MRDSSRRIAMCGLLCALAVTLMLLGGLIPLAVYCCPILAMAALLPIREDWGTSAALCAYAVVALLSFLLVSNIEQVFVYMFLGWYPAAQPYLDRLPPGLRILAKLALFQGSILIMYVFLLKVFCMEAVAEDLSGLRLPMALALLLMGNLLFLTADLLFKRLCCRWNTRKKK